MDRQGEIGWVFDPDHGGQGYATEATSEVVRIAFDELGLHRVWAQLDPRNTASAALAVRLGMRQEAHLREESWFKGEWGDLAIYALLSRVRCAHDRERRRPRSPGPRRRHRRASVRRRPGVPLLLPRRRDLRPRGRRVRRLAVRPPCHPEHSVGRRRRRGGRDVGVTASCRRQLGRSRAGAGDPRTTYGAGWTTTSTRSRPCCPRSRTGTWASSRPLPSRLAAGWPAR